MVDLRSEIQDKVYAALVSMGTINVACTYRRIADPTYVASTGVATNPITSSHSISVIFDEFTASKLRSTDSMEDEQPVRSIDKIAIIAGQVLGFDPSVGDIILVISTSQTWRILGVTSDPVGAHYELHIRPTNE